MTAAKRPSFRHRPAALNPRQATHAGMHRHDGTVFIYFIPFIGLYRPLLAFNSEVSFLWSRKPVLGLVCLWMHMLYYCSEQYHTAGSEVTDISPPD